MDGLVCVVDCCDLISHVLSRTSSLDDLKFRCGRCVSLVVNSKGLGGGIRVKGREEGILMVLERLAGMGGRGEGELGDVEDIAGRISRWIVPGGGIGTRYGTAKRGSVKTARLKMLKAMSLDDCVSHVFRECEGPRGSEAFGAEEFGVLCRKVGEGGRGAKYAREMGNAMDGMGGGGFRMDTEAANCMFEAAGGEEEVRGLLEEMRSNRRYRDRPKPNGRSYSLCMQGVKSRGGDWRDIWEKAKEDGMAGSAAGGMWICSSGNVGEEDMEEIRDSGSITAAAVNDALEGIEGRGGLGAGGLLELLDWLIVDEVAFDSEGYERMWRMCRDAKGEEEYEVRYNVLFVMGEGIVGMGEGARDVVREGTRR
ncbi:hypothetical protein TrRE_jg1713, partial [Triparma retinervis]